jgi:hypothetical protein
MAGFPVRRLMRLAGAAPTLSLGSPRLGRGWGHQSLLVGGRCVPVVVGSMVAGVHTLKGYLYRVGDNFIGVAWNYVVID